MLIAGINLCSLFDFVINSRNEDTLRTFPCPVMLSSSLCKFSKQELFLKFIDAWHRFQVCNHFFKFYFIKMGRKWNISFDFQGVIELFMKIVRKTGFFEIYSVVSQISTLEFNFFCCILGKLTDFICKSRNFRFSWTWIVLFRKYLNTSSLEIRRYLDEHSTMWCHSTDFAEIPNLYQNSFENLWNQVNCELKENRQDSRPQPA